jgi:hypothetical protein
MDLAPRQKLLVLFHSFYGGNAVTVEKVGEFEYSSRRGSGDL